MSGVFSPYNHPDCICHLLFGDQRKGHAAICPLSEISLYYHTWHDIIILKDSNGDFWSDSAFYKDSITRYITIAPKRDIIYIGEL